MQQAFLKVMKRGKSGKANILKLKRLSIPEPDKLIIVAWQPKLWYQGDSLDAWAATHPYMTVSRLPSSSREPRSPEAAGTYRGHAGQRAEAGLAPSHPGRCPHHLPPRPPPCPRPHPHPLPLWPPVSPEGSAAWPKGLSHPHSQWKVTPDYALVGRPGQSFSIKLAHVRFQ